jgi:putative chitinase
MDAAQTLAFLAVGALLGAGGQVLRAFIGIKKQIEAARLASPPRTVADWFDGKKLGFSFALGALAGILAAVAQYAPDQAITRDLLMGFAAAGYGGADFIEGLMQKWLPSE